MGNTGKILNLLKINIGRCFIHITSIVGFFGEKDCWDTNHSGSNWNNIFDWQLFYGPTTNLMHNLSKQNQCWEWRTAREIKCPQGCRIRWENHQQYFHGRDTWFPLSSRRRWGSRQMIYWHSLSQRSRWRPRNEGQLPNKSTSTIWSQGKPGISGSGVSSSFCVWVCPWGNQQGWWG